MWRGWKNRMTTQNRQKSNAKKEKKNWSILFVIYLYVREYICLYTFIYLYISHLFVDIQLQNKILLDMLFSQRSRNKMYKDNQLYLSSRPFTLRPYIVRQSTDTKTCLIGTLNCNAHCPRSLIITFTYPKPIWDSR